MSESSWPTLGVELAFLGLLALLWGSSYLLIKVALQTIPPVTLIAIRVSTALVVLSTIAVMRGEHWPKDGKTWRMLFIQALLFSIGAWTILAWGQQYIESGLASVLNSTTPIFVFFITALVTRHEPITSLKLIGACLGLIGVTLIVGVDVLRGLGQQVLAQLAILLSSLLYGCAAIYGKKFAHLSPLMVATGMMIWATFCLVPMSAVMEQPWTLAPAFGSIVAALALGIFCTGLALLLYFRLLRTLGSMGVASQSYLRAAVGVVLGISFLGERFTPLVGLGLAAAILGVMAINLPSPSWSRIGRRSPSGSAGRFAP
ncbi:MAG: EamA family transporter [Pseudomonadota bacterium]